MKWADKWMVCAALLFSIYLLDIVLGKAALLWDIDVLSSLLIGDVAEFLLLLSAVVCFTIEILRRESPRRAE